MTKNIRLVEFKDEEVYPITKSAEGTNAFYCEFCNFAGYRPAYASCLNRINNGCNGAVESACAGAINKGHCPSLALQKEELSAGHAIYYVNRVKMRQNQVENAEVMGIRLGSPVESGLKSAFPMSSKPESNVPQGIPHAPEFKTGGYADALNKKLKELNAKQSESSTSPSEKVVVESKKSVTGDLAKPKVKTPPLNTQGLSLLEIARLRKQQAQA